MKITIIIEHAQDQTGDEVKPQITIERQPQAPPFDNMGSEYTFRKLTDFIPSNEGHYGNTNAAKTYHQGRKTHQCGNCGAPNRHMTKDGYCKDCRGKSSAWVRKSESD